MAVEYDSREEAVDDAVRWLEKLRSLGGYDWEWESRSILTCELLPGLPVFVFGVASLSEGKWAPDLAFTVGVKHETRYWQGRVGELNDPSVLSEKALAVLVRVLGVLRNAARLTLPAPARS